MRILVTGGAGFIGSHFCEKVLQRPDVEVVCFDNFDPYYAPEIKRDNIAELQKNPRFHCFEGDLLRDEDLERVFSTFSPDSVCHLAAQAGVRHSIAHPRHVYEVNVNGTLSLLEHIRRSDVKKTILASTSAIYGNQEKVPFSESDPVDYPISPYAASKKSVELMAYHYHHLDNMPIACIRFFTVYGPRQRPDMAIHKFTKAILKGTPLDVYNQGKCERDYTHVSDIVQGISQILDAEFTFDIVNLGGNVTTSTLDLIQQLESVIGLNATLKLLPAQPGDVNQTFADISKAHSQYGYTPKTSVLEGLHTFWEWYKKSPVGEK